MRNQIIIWYTIDKNNIVEDIRTNDIYDILVYNFNKFNPDIFLKKLKQSFENKILTNNSILNEEWEILRLLGDMQYNNKEYYGGCMILKRILETKDNETIDYAFNEISKQIIEIINK